MLKTETGPYCTGKTGRMAPKNPGQEKTGDLESLPKHREFGLLK